MNVSLKKIMPLLLAVVVFISSCKEKTIDPDKLVIDGSTYEKYKESMISINSKLDEENWNKFYIAVGFAFYVSAEQKKGMEGFLEVIHNRTAGKMIRVYDQMRQEDKDWVMSQNDYWDKKEKQEP